jgi:hypothetical protein
MGVAHVRIELNNSIDQIKLGDQRYSYGRFAEAEESGDAIILAYKGSDYDFQIRDDGIYTIGYQKTLAPEGIITGANRYETLTRLQETYVIICYQKMVIFIDL